jgi:aminoglycoside/choline kinase family phosphotransferase
MTYYLHLLNSWYLPTNFEITVTSRDSHEMKAFKPPASELLDSIAIQKTGCRDWQSTWVIAGSDRVGTRNIKIPFQLVMHRNGIAFGG